MKTQLHKFFFRDTATWWYWFLFALICKLGIFIFQISVHPPQTELPGFWGVIGGDTFSYLPPVDKLVQHGSYWPDYRMPGYGIAYLPLIILFSKATACNILIVIQLMLAAFSVYVLALTVKKIFKSDTFFYFTFYVFSISCLSNLCDAYLLSESLTASFLIFSTYFIVRYFEKFNLKYLLLSGFFFSWVIFLRPIFVPLLPFYCIVLVVQLIKLKRSFKLAALIFLSSFILMDGLWIVRNYRCYKSIIPLTRLLYFPAISETQIGPAREFVRAWGGDDLWWDADADVRWFGRKDDPPGRIPLTDKEVHPPADIYTSKFNEDSLIRIKEIFKELEAEKYGWADSLSAEGKKFHLLRDKLNLYRASIMHEKPMIYYVRGPLKALKRFLINSGNNDLFYYIPDNKLNLFQQIFKLFYCGFYYMIIIFGFLAVFLMSKSIIRLTLFSIVAMVPLYTVVIHALILKVAEYRYLLPAFPFLIVCAIYGFFRIYDLTIGKQSPVKFLPEGTKFKEQ